ncbi:MAG: glycine zipper domain-containing protein [Ginsengibacter sp.]
MKKLLTLLLIATFLSCHNRQSELDSQKIVPLDTSNVLNNNYSTDHASGVAAPVSPTSVAPTGPVKPVAHSAATNNHPSANNNSNGTSTSNGTYSEPAPTKPKGFSSAAKDATIGGVGGAVIGGVVTHSVGGAVIGGAIGAGGGYILGRAKDKRTGRVAQGKRYRRYNN